MVLRLFASYRCHKIRSAAKGEMKGSQLFSRKVKNMRKGNFLSKRQWQCGMESGKFEFILSVGKEYRDVSIFVGR
jgi:hypothetical protein